MPKIKSRAPVSSFGPELQAVLRKGSEEEVQVKFETPALATRFVHRVHDLRSAMRKESHPDADQLYRAGLRIDRTDPCTVIIAPKDSEFRSALTLANIQPLTEPRSTPPSPPTELVIDSLSAAESFLATLSEPPAEPPEKDEKDVDNGG